MVGDAGKWVVAWVTAAAGAAAAVDDGDEREAARAAVAPAASGFRSPGRWPFAHLLPPLPVGAQVVAFVAGVRGARPDARTEVAGLADDAAGFVACLTSADALLLPCGSHGDVRGAFAAPVLPAAQVLGAGARTTASAGEAKISVRDLHFSPGFTSTSPAVGRKMISIRVFFDPMLSWVRCKSPRSATEDLRIRKQKMRMQDTSEFAPLKLDAAFFILSTETSLPTGRETYCEDASFRAGRIYGMRINGP